MARARPSGGKTTRRKRASKKPQAQPTYTSTHTQRRCAPRVMPTANPYLALSLTSLHHDDAFVVV